MGDEVMLRIEGKDGPLSAAAAASLAGKLMPLAAGLPWGSGAPHWPDEVGDAGWVVTVPLAQGAPEQNWRDTLQMAALAYVASREEDVGLVRVSDAVGGIARLLGGAATLCDGAVVSFDDAGGLRAAPVSDAHLRAAMSEALADPTAFGIAPADDAALWQDPSSDDEDAELDVVQRWHWAMQGPPDGRSPELIEAEAVVYAADTEGDVPVEVGFAVLVPATLAADAITVRLLLRSPDGAVLAVLETEEEGLQPGELRTGQAGGWTHLTAAERIASIDAWFEVVSRERDEVEASVRVDALTDGTVLETIAVVWDHRSPLASRAHLEVTWELPDGTPVHQGESPPRFLASGAQLMVETVNRIVPDGGRGATPKVLVVSERLQGVGPQVLDDRAGAVSEALDAHPTPAPVPPEAVRAPATLDLDPGEPLPDVVGAATMVDLPPTPMPPERPPSEAFQPRPPMPPVTHGRLARDPEAVREPTGPARHGMHPGRLSRDPEPVAEAPVPVAAVPPAPEPSAPSAPDLWDHVEAGAYDEALTLARADGLDITGRQRLSELLADDDDARVVLGCRLAVAAGWNGAATLLRRSLSHPSAPVRAAAAEALGLLAGPSMVPALRRLGDDDDVAVVTAAEVAVARLLGHGG